MKPSLIFKTIGIVLIAVVILNLAFQLIGSTFRPDPYRNDYTQSSNNYGGQMEAKQLSMRNIAPMVDPDYNEDFSEGGDTENFEVTEYYATVETRNAKKTCAIVSDLKVKKYIIFENSNEHDRGCNYSFKVQKENLEEVLNVIDSLDPKDVSENIFSIKQIVSDFTSEEEVLTKKKASIEKTLEDAVNAYNEIAKVATDTQDAESLAKIIDSKIRIIERLTQEKININERLDRLERAKQQQLDRLNYAYFNVRIFENKYFDANYIKDSWKNSIKRFVSDINEILQNITINLVTLLFRGIQFVLYFFIILVVAKYTWRLAKRVWNK